MLEHGNRLSCETLINEDEKKKKKKTTNLTALWQALQG